MALPKIDLPLYQCELPSTGKKIKYRPFTVKEEKILLTAQESKDPAQIMLAIKQILNNCLYEIDVSHLAIFDIEYMLIQLRSRSVDNTAEFEITDPETEEKIKLEINLADVKVKRNKDHTNKIKISEEYTLFLHYPNIDQFEDLMEKEEQSTEDSFNVMISCLDKLASKDDVYKFKDFPKKEVDEFVDSLHSDTIKEIKKFFDTMPKIRHEMPYVNSKGDQKTFVLEGTQTFFI
jgi:glycine cleavage system regulatory protein